MSRARLLTGEAVAYVRSGLYATTRPQVTHRPGRRAEVGVLLVHGLGADRTQFHTLSRALKPTGAWIGAFDYRIGAPFARTVRGLAESIRGARADTDRLVVVGHSLGGVLLSLVLQGDDPPPHVAGFVSICAPLHGTTRGRFAPWRDLRGITPDGEHIQKLGATRERLALWGKPILTIGAEEDAFVDPPHSAFLPAHATLRLSGAGHVASLFDPRTHNAVADFVRAVATAPRA